MRRVAVVEGFAERIDDSVPRICFIPGHPPHPAKRQRSTRVSLPFYGWQPITPKPIPGYPAELRHIGDHLLRRRLELGLQQREAAHMLGMTQQHQPWRDVFTGL